MNIKTLKKYKSLLDMGLTTDEVHLVHNERERTHKNRNGRPPRYSECPKCRHMHLNETGAALGHCHCGYCIHSDQTGTTQGIRCNKCGKKSPPFIELTSDLFETFEIEP